jgi:hypothetical protein
MDMCYMFHSSQFFQFNDSYSIIWGEECKLQIIAQVCHFWTNAGECGSDENRLARVRVKMLNITKQL